jgi:hypothetical protein
MGEAFAVHLTNALGILVSTLKNTLKTQKSSVDSTLGGWERVINKAGQALWKNTATGATSKGIRAEDNSYVNPDFYKNNPPEFNAWVNQWKSGDKSLNWLQYKAKHGVTSDVASRATGGIVDELFTILNERGGELVTLPNGSLVHTAQETDRMLSQSLAMTSPSNPFLSGSGAGSRGTTVIQNTNNTREGDVFHFHGDMHFGDQKVADDFFAEIDRRSGRKTELGRRGMLPTDELPVW